MEDTLTSMEEHIEDSTNITKKEDNVTEIESALHQIASSLQSTAGAYMTLASCIHNLEPYKIPQVVLQVPPLPISVPVPVGEALTVDGEDGVVGHLVCGECGLTETSWSKLQRGYGVAGGGICSALEGGGMPGGSLCQ